MIKCLVVTLTAVMLAAVLAVAPAGADHGPNIGAHVVAESPDAGPLYSSDGGSTWTATKSQYLAGEADPAGDNGDGPAAGTFQYRWTVEYSSDGGSTWTATRQQYFDGEHADNGDGPAAGTFRAQSSINGLYSDDGGSRWGAGLRREYLAGEADPTGDNGDGPNAGTFRYRSTWFEYSFNGGSTWTEWEPPEGRWGAFNPQYLAGEADPTGDNGDGPNAGTFRYRLSSKPVIHVTIRCSTERRVGDFTTPFWTAKGTSWPSLRDFSCPHTNPTYTWNVDDGIEPAGSWCVSGLSRVICDGEGYTYREAREELGYNLGPGRGPS